MVDNLAIGLFPVLVTLLGSYVNFLQANPAMFGVVAGIYWAPCTGSGLLDKSAA